MAVDKLIHKHIDALDDLEDRFEKELEDAYKALSSDIDSLIEDPETVLKAFVAEVGDILETEYAPEAVEKGIEVAKEMEGLSRKIEIPLTDDPNLNEDILDDDKSDD